MTPASSYDDDFWARLPGFARELQARQHDIESTLESITRGAAALVPGAVGAGITLVTGRGRVESRASTSSAPQRLDELQQELGEGPCLRAISEQATIEVTDLSTDPRWPRFAAAAVELGVRSMLSFQLYTARENLGALNIFGAQPGAFEADAREMGHALATHAAIALSGAQQQIQWQSSLVSRDIIGQAKGMLMERYQIDALQAFDLLRQLSQESNTKLADVARAVVARP